MHSIHYRVYHVLEHLHVFFYSYVLHSGRLCIHVHILPFSLSIGLFHLTEKEHQRDTDDDDSGMGPSTFTDTKSTTFSEVSY